MGTMSINVLERTVRSASCERSAHRMVQSSRCSMIEGVLIGLLSWLIWERARLPLSKLLSDAVGLAFWQAPLATRSHRWRRVWFVVVVIISPCPVSCPPVEHRGHGARVLANE